jgi:protein transport protein SEC24
MTQCGTIGDEGVILPQPLPLSSERLERHGLHLIEDGQNIFLWIGRDAVPQLVMDVFDIGSYVELRGGKVSFLAQTSNVEAIFDSCRNFRIL